MVDAGGSLCGGALGGCRAERCTNKRDMTIDGGNERWRMRLPIWRLCGQHPFGTGVAECVCGWELAVRGSFLLIHAVSDPHKRLNELTGTFTVSGSKLKRGLGSGGAGGGGGGHAPPCDEECGCKRPPLPVAIQRGVACPAAFFSSRPCSCDGGSAPGTRYYYTVWIMERKTPIGGTTSATFSRRRTQHCREERELIILRTDRPGSRRCRPPPLQLPPDPQQRPRPRRRRPPPPRAPGGAARCRAPRSGRAAAAGGRHCLARPSS